MILTPINEAEAVFQRFYDPQRCHLEQWSFSADPRTQSDIQQQFHACVITWRRGQGLLVARLERTLSLDAGPHDHLILCARLPSTARLTLHMEVDGQRVTLLDAVTGENYPKEYEAPLPGRRITAARLEITDESGSPGNALLFWMGLFHAARRQAMLDVPSPYRDGWDDLVAPKGQHVDPLPQLGLFFGAEDLPRLRRKMASGPYRQLMDRLGRIARQALSKEPWRGVGRFPNNPKPRCCWFHNPGHIDTLAMRLGAFVGLIEEDESLLRMAVDHALALAHCEYWYPEFCPVIAGSSWEQRCFYEFRWAQNVIYAWDWAGAYLTPAGQQLLAQGVSTKALPWILQTLMRHPYVRECNQGAYFSWGAIVCELALSKVYPHAAELLDAAVKALDQTVQTYFTADGGAFEGPGYVTATAGHALAAYQLVARHRGVPVTDLVPANLKQMWRYVSTMVSTVPPYGSVITVADGGRQGVCMYQEAFAMLAGLTGDREVSALLAGMIGQDEQFVEDDGTPGGVAFSVIYGPDELPAPFVSPPVFRILEHTGILCSCRPTPQGPVRVQFIGGPANAGHCHEDRGSFVVEAFGEEILIDRGQMSYGDPRSTTLIYARYHNLLMPEGPDDPLPGQLNPCPTATIPQGRGDERSLDAQIDAGAAWGALVTRWVRRIQSEQPLSLRVIDEMDLPPSRTSRRVSFHLHSRFPWVRQGEHWITTGRLAEVTVVPEWGVDESSGVEDMVDGKKKPVYHLSLTAPPAPSHRLTTQLILRSL